MRAALFLLVVLPFVCAAPEKRIVFDTLTSLFSLDQLKADLQTILDTIGSNATEKVCEDECHMVVTHDVLDTGCPLMCHSFQALVLRFNLTPDPTTTAAGR